MTVQTDFGDNSLLNKRVIVCCGAGGVGKTTVSTALAIALARFGRRVLVVTIDPSRRLAETLGIATNLPRPVELSAESLEAAGISPPGSLSAWVLDPKAVSDRTVRRLVSNAEEASTLLGNRIYRDVTSMVAGMQEYAAVEALHGFVLDDTYDVVVLDTPPSRNALRFLEAPKRAVALLDSRILNLFVPDENSVIRQLATRLFEEVLDLAFGRNVRDELQVFFRLFGQILGHLNGNQKAIQEYFRRDSVGFLLVTSPSQEALREARYFEKKTRDELELNLCGYVLNRSMAFAIDRALPDPSMLPEDAPDTLRRALEKLHSAATLEAEMASRHRELTEELRRRAGRVFVLPEAAHSPTEMFELGRLGEILSGMISSKRSISIGVLENEPQSALH